MSEHLNKFQILKLIYIAANIYKDKLLNKQFMFVFNNEFVEVQFKKENFKHLTGVDSVLSANQFFKKIISLRLYPGHIQFNSYHPYELSISKLSYLNKIDYLLHNECVALKDITTQTSKYTFGSTNLYFALLFEKEINENGHAVSSKLIIKSIRGGCCIDKAKTKYFVDYIFSKDSNSNKYNNLCFYKDLKIEIPKEVINKLDKDLIDKIICIKTKL